MLSLSPQLGEEVIFFLVYIGQQQYTFVTVQIAFEPEDHDSVGIYNYIRVQFLERRKGKDRDMLFTCVIW